MARVVRLAVLAPAIILGACRDAARWDVWGPYVPPPMAEALPSGDEPPTASFVAAFGDERPPLSAGQVIAVVHALDKGNILAADVADVRAAAPATVEVARTMREHAVIDDRRLDGAVNDLGVAPLPSALESRLRVLVDERVARLDAQPVAGFDAVFLDDAIASHERASELLQRWLIPAAQPMALRSLLAELLHWNGVRLRAAREARARLGASA